MTSSRPTIAHWVPGELTRPNSHQSELCLDWGVEADGRRLWLRNYLDFDDSITPEQAKDYLPLAELPALPMVATAAELEALLRQRFEAHPLANQLYPVVELVDRVLIDVPPLEVARASARYLCVGGVARALGRALAGTGGGAFRSREDIREIRRVARASLLLELGALACLPPGRAERERALALLDHVPEYPDGKHSGHDGGNHDDVCLEYDRILCEYLRGVSSCVDRALALPGERLDQVPDPYVPSRVFTPEQALAAVAESPATRPWRYEALELGFALVELCGQPLEAVRPVLAAALSGESPVAPAEHVRITPEGLADPHTVRTMLRVLLATDLDLTEQIAERARQKAEVERLRAEARAEVETRSAPRRSWSWVEVALIGALLVVVLWSACR